MDEMPCTATGLQLLRRLNRLAARLLNNALPASQGRRLAATLAELDHRERRQTALTHAVDILDAGQGLSRWALALALESALARFDAVGYRRVLDGHRQPTDLEKNLIVLLESGPRCASKLWLEIRDLPGRG